MDRFFYNALLFIIALILIAFLSAVFWHHIAFTYLFQALVSFGLIIAGFYYIFRPGVAANIRIGLFLIVLSPSSFYLAELLLFVGISTFRPGDFQIPMPAIYDVFRDCMYTKIRIGNIWISLLNIFGVFFLVGNAVMLARRPIPRVFIAGNIIMFSGCILIYHLYR